MARRIPPRACMGFPDISKRTVIGSMDEGSKTRTFLEALDDDQWQVTAFEPENRLVCIDVTSDHGMVHHMTITLPVISTSWMK